MRSAPKQSFKASREIPRDTHSLTFVLVLYLGIKKLSVSHSTNHPGHIFLFNYNFVTFLFQYQTFLFHYNFISLYLYHNWCHFLVSLWFCIFVQIHLSRNWSSLSQFYHSIVILYRCISIPLDHPDLKFFLFHYNFVSLYRSHNWSFWPQGIFVLL